MQTKTVTWGVAGGFLLSVAMGCSVAAGQTAQPGEPGATASAIHGRHDPAQFVQRFDKDRNGTLEIAELPERMQKWLAQADANRDGKLSVDELKAHAQARRDQMFQRADKDGNGSLSAEELGPRWERLRVADADNNGSVTRAELDQARSQGKLQFGSGHRGHGGKHEGDAACAKGHGHGFERLDKNHDGAVTADEVKERFWAHIVKADANKDGRVTKEELERARAEHGKK